MVRIPLPRPLEGIVPPMITPLGDRQELDTRGADALASRLVNGGVAGIFVLGTCGEGPAVSHRVRCELIERVCVVVDGRVPVLVGVSSPSLADALELAEMADDLGATAIVATPPFYYPTDAAGGVHFLRRLADCSPLPVIVYNMPGCVGLSLTPDMLHQLTDEPNIAGFKDSCGDIERFREFVEATKNRPDWMRMVGPEHLLVDAIAAGATGGVHGGANVFPKLFVELYAAVKQGDQETVRRLSEKTALLGRIYGPQPSIHSVIRGIKAALAELSLCGQTTSDVIASIDSNTLRSVCDTVAQLTETEAYRPAHAG